MSEPAAPGPKKKRRLPLATLLCLLPVGGCVALGVVQSARLSRHRAAGVSAAAPVIAALDAQLQDGACPDALEGLVPARLAALPAQRLAYRCAGAERRYWLAFNDDTGLGLPSDLVHEYDSAARQWSTVDWSQSEAFREPSPK